MAGKWPQLNRVSFHKHGWMVFRFANLADKDYVIINGNFAIFGTPLILCNLPKDFRFDTYPVFKFKVWATFPNLPLPLWNLNALGKLASIIG